MSSKLAAALAAAALGGATLNALAAPTIENLAAKQRFPWNNTVDVSYTVGGTIEDGAKYNLSFAYVTDGGRTTNAISSVARTVEAAGDYTETWEVPAGVSERGCKFIATCEAAKAEAGDAVWMIVDLATGGVGYADYDFDTATNTFNTAEYKTAKMVFRRIAASTEEKPYYVRGTGSSGGTAAIMERDYWMGIFPVTVAQYTLMTNADATVTADKDSMKPKGMVRWDSLRGTTKVTAQGEVDNAVSPAAIYTLNARTGLKFDVPTEFMWEVACRAFDAGDEEHKNWKFPFSQNDNNTELNKYAWWNNIRDDDGYGNTSGTRVVGTRLPNAWGIYDMMGNVWEWLADGVSYAKYNQTPCPENGNAAFSKYRFQRGGPATIANYISPGYRDSYTEYDSPMTTRGFRLACIIKE